MVGISNVLFLIINLFIVINRLIMLSGNGAVSDTYT